MSKIGLIDVDSHNFPNLALMKISAHHKATGDTVEWHTPLDSYDKVYVSKIFTFTPDIDYCINADEVAYGGTGYDLVNKLPIEIERVCPDYDLYPQFDEAYGFLSRGCPRNCGFCIVSKKEGRISHQVADLQDFYRGQKTIKLLDPNLLACKDSEKLLQQLADSKACVDFTQGLDIRFITKDNMQIINKIKTKMIHFARDNPKQDLTKDFTKFQELTRIKGYVKKKVYVLTNYNSTHEEDMHRIYTLKNLGFDPYVMVYEKDTAEQVKRQVQRWVNNKIIFRSGKAETFEDYLNYDRGEQQ